MANVVYEYEGRFSWFVEEEPLGGFALFMNYNFQYEFTNLDAAKNWIDECESE
ncbi:hypothetical protein [Acinetobacter sp. NRRL B-65365]|uniref:hypothetical protein n=1 Tax=Acinetobacter sp. NRRL B-65365 TaxID=1785092 RepID=UPI000A9A8BA5|nr:hypothetical protein [Acinetobacter sp. NRRL B-65365]